MRVSGNLAALHHNYGSRQSHIVGSQPCPLIRFENVFRRRKGCVHCPEPALPWHLGQRALFRLVLHVQDNVHVRLALADVGKRVRRQPRLGIVPRGLVQPPAVPGHVGQTL
jgi:hypothetical protein